MATESTVSTLSILFMGVSAALSIFVPVGLVIFMGLKKRLNWKATLAGAILFVVFVLVLERTMHILVLGTDMSKSALYNNLILYMLYGGFAAGLFEETARLLGFKFLLKVREKESPDTGISYGLGHGGIEAVLLGGLAVVSSMVTAIMLNSGALGSIASALKGDQLTAFNQQISNLVNANSFLFLATGIERISAIMIQIGLSLFVFKAVKEKKWLFYVYAILLHAGIDMFAILFQRGVIKNIVLLEGAVFVAAAVVMAAGFALNKGKPVREIQETQEIAETLETSEIQQEERE
jgi:uncharacterized membrane protein YhfC